MKSMRKAVMCTAESYLQGNWGVEDCLPVKRLDLLHDVLNQERQIKRRTCMARSSLQQSWQILPTLGAWWIRQLGERPE